MLNYAVAEANEKILQNSGMRLAVEVQTIARGREYGVSKRVCNLLEVIKSYDSLNLQTPNENAYTFKMKKNTRFVNTK